MMAIGPLLLVQISGTSLCGIFLSALPLGSLMILSAGFDFESAASLRFTSSGAAGASMLSSPPAMRGAGLV